MSRAEQLRQDWRSRLQADHPKQSPVVHESIINWLLGESPERLDTLEGGQWVIAQQAMDYRFRILEQRYLSVAQERAYRNLLQRLNGLFLIRSKVRTWVALSRDRQRTVMDVLQEVIQELIHSDSYIRQQMQWIAQCTTDLRLRNALTLASLEEYCLRPIRNQPLLVYRFVNYLRRSQRGGMTQVPTGELIRLVSDEIVPDDADNPISLVDSQVMTQYQEQQAWEDQQAVRDEVKQEFVQYLRDRDVDPMAVEWLELYLQGKTQDEITQILNRPKKEIYRLREKISYHAMNVFAPKARPDLVLSWLGTAPSQNFGLTTQQWEKLCERLSPDQQRLLDALRGGLNLEAIARDWGIKVNQVTGEWTKLYLMAQEIRGESSETPEGN